MSRFIESNNSDIRLHHCHASSFSVDTQEDKCSSALCSVEVGGNLWTLSLDIMELGCVILGLKDRHAD